MALSTMTVRLDSQMKQQFDALCQQFGMSSNAAINVFVNQVVRSRSIPFKVTVDTSDNDDSRTKFLETLRDAHYRAQAGELPDLTLEEINREIGLTRQEMKKRQKEEA
jgi:DNA-damage-inducible protein J